MKPNSSYYRNMRHRVSQFEQSMAEEDYDPTKFVGGPPKLRDPADDDTTVYTGNFFTIPNPED